MPYATGSIECILLWQRPLKRTFAETVSQLLSANLTCSDQVAFDADMLFIVTVEPLLIFNIVYGTTYTT